MAALPIYKSRTGILLLSWHGFCILWASLLGLTGGDWKLVITLVLWTVLSIALYLIRPRFFIVVGICLAVLEEALVFSLGGGLHGKAPSLSYDLTATIPSFAGFILGWFVSLKVQPWTETALYIGAGLHGFLLEFIMTGLIRSPTAVLFLGGPVLFIYGSLVLIPQPPKPNESRKPSMLRGAVMWLMTLVLMVIGSIVADNLLRLAR